MSSLIAWHKNKLARARRLAEDVDALLTDLGLVATAMAPAASRDRVERIHAKVKRFIRATKRTPKLESK